MNRNEEEVSEIVNNIWEAGYNHESYCEVGVKEILKFCEAREKAGAVAGDFKAVSDKLKSAEREVEEIHVILDGDESMIIRNAKDGYPEGRPDQVLTLAERVKALCKYASDWKRWFNEAEREVARRCAEIAENLIEPEAMSDDQVTPDVVAKAIRKEYGIEVPDDQ